MISTKIAHWRFKAETHTPTKVWVSALMF